MFIPVAISMLPVNLIRMTKCKYKLLFYVSIDHFNQIDKCKNISNNL